MLSDGDADVGISHAPVAEANALTGHPHWWYRKIMYNDFILVGPQDDPSKVGAASSLEDALRRIAAGEAPFLSPADASGTFEREQALWQLADASRRGSGLSQRGREWVRRCGLPVSRRTTR
jgi:tungstate transport system substrate-binding protein